MNKINKLFILCPFLILGCMPKSIEEFKNIQRIDSLKMNIYTNGGEILYSITSPYSSYDNTSNTFKSNKTKINLFNGQKVKYIINSDKSQLSKKNKLLELTGNVEIKSKQEEYDKLNSERFIWDINKTTYTLLGKVKFENNDVILSSDKAILNSDNVIEFFNPVKYLIKNDNKDGIYEINSENAFYDINSKTVSFSSKDKRVRSKIYF